MKNSSSFISKGQIIKESNAAKAIFSKVFPLTTEPETTSIDELDYLFEEYLNRYPFAYFELARTRTTEWMCWVKENPKASEAIVCEQGLTMKDACVNAVKKLKDYLKSRDG